MSSDLVFNLTSEQVPSHILKLAKFGSNFVPNDSNFSIYCTKMFKDISLFCEKVKYRCNKYLKPKNLLHLTSTKPSDEVLSDWIHYINNEFKRYTQLQKLNLNKMSLSAKLTNSSFSQISHFSTMTNFNNLKLNMSTHLLSKLNQIKNDPDFKVTLADKNLAREKYNFLTKPYKTSQS